MVRFINIFFIHKLHCLKHQIQNFQYFQYMLQQSRVWSCGVVWCGMSKILYYQVRTVSIILTEDELLASKLGVVVN